VAGQVLRPDYDQYALNLVRHGVFSLSVSAPYYPGVTRTPGYPAFLAVLYLIKTHSALLVQIAQYALVVVLAWLVYLLALQLTEARIARVSAFLTATYLPFLWFATSRLDTVLALVLATLLVFVVLKARDRRDANWLWVAAGATLAANAYVRPDVAGLGVILTLGIVLDARGRWVSRSRLLPPAIMLVTMVVGIAPWTVRNLSTTGSFVPLDASAGSSLMASADQYAGTISYKFTVADWARYDAQSNAVTMPVSPLTNSTARQQVASDSALTEEARRIFSRQSIGGILKSIPRRIAYLWGTADFTPEGTSWSLIAHRLAQLQYALLGIFALAGLVMRRRTLLREWPLWITAAYLTALHLVFHVEGRYSLTARPMLFIYAATAVTASVQRIPGARRSQSVPDRDEPTLV
jgi:hypothetical protein